MEKAAVPPIILSGALKKISYRDGAAISARIRPGLSQSIMPTPRAFRFSP